MQKQVCVYIYIYDNVADLRLYVQIGTSKISSTPLCYMIAMIGTLTWPKDSEQLTNLYCPFKNKSEILCDIFITSGISID